MIRHVEREDAIRTFRLGRYYVNCRNDDISSTEAASCSDRIRGKLALRFRA